MTDKELGRKCEKAIQFLCKHMTDVNDWRKPVLFHDIRVGTRLYNDGYAPNIIIAGFLHDVLEDCANVSEELLQKEFGKEITILVKASTKDDFIANPEEKIDELITRCISVGEDALIIKTADVLDNFAYYISVDNQKELYGHCMRNARIIFEHKPTDFTDKIFDELTEVHKQYL